jgi:hypothetical protein
MKLVPKYTVITGQYLNDFIAEVNEALARGFMVTGPLIVFPSPGRQVGLVDYFQPMVKYGKE